MKNSIYLSICLSIYLSISLNAQVNNSKDVEKNEGIKRNAMYNLEEIKVRWKKAALENCPGVPCVTTTIPGAPTSVVATAGNASASVAFTAPASNGGSAITGYTVTSSPGSFTATGATSPINVTGLTNGTAYTFTVTATNAAGSSVASTASTSVTPVAPACGAITTVTDVDNNSYNTVSIGTQCWTMENLKVTKYNDGTSIPLDNSGSSTGYAAGATWSSKVTGAYTIYANEPSTGTNATNYGFLYNWYAAAGIITNGGSPTKNICPTGWHVPTDAEWTTLTTYLGGQSVAGDKMKSTSNLWTATAGANNSSGFSAIPGGYRNSVGSFLSIRDYAIFWSAPENVGYAWFRSLHYTLSDVSRFNYFNKSVGASVRCLRD